MDLEGSGVDMTDRPTPEQIAYRLHGNGALMLDLIKAQGYVIVHPDDHPPMDDAPEKAGSYIRGVFFGRNETLRDIFGWDRS